MALIDGDDFVSGDIDSFQQNNRMKNQWRQADPTNVANLSNPQPGMIVSDSDDEKLYHRQAASWGEIIQTATPISDDAQIIGGDNSDMILIPYEETTNDAIIWGLPVAAKRGLIFCDVADIAANFTGFITAHAQPTVFWSDLDTDSYLAIGHSADDKPDIYSNNILNLQYEANAGVDFFANSGSGENQAVRIFGWNTAGGDLESTSLIMDDTNDEFLIQAPNSVNHEGITVDLLETNQRFRIRQNSDIMSFYLTTTDAYIRWSDGELTLMTDEGVNTSSVIGLKGKGTGRGKLQIYDQDDAEFLYLSCFSGRANIYTDGVAPSFLDFQSATIQDIRFWPGIPSGNPSFIIHGWNTAGGDLETTELTMDDTNDEFLIQAANSANHEGITISIPEANQRFRVRGAAGAERFWVDEDGLIGLMRQGEMMMWTYQGDLADDATFNLPAITDACWGFIQFGNNEEYALFTVDDDGDVTLISNSANIVANADTDTNGCIGTAATQEPLVIKNRLGATKNVNLIIWYS